MKRLRVGVIYGGRSSEHEVSVASAASVINNLDRTRYEPIPLLIEKDGRWTLPDEQPTATSAAEVIARTPSDATQPHQLTHETHLVGRPGKATLLTISSDDTGPECAPGVTRALITSLALDLIFPVLHGPYGEDGTVQGLLELANIPYVGAPVLASALGMDKATMKVLFATRRLPVVKHVIVWRSDWKVDRARAMTAVTKHLSFPMFVKPTNLGSSIGITKAKTSSKLEGALNYASEFDRKIIVEEAVPNAREIECAVLGNDRPETSVPGEILPTQEFYNYQAKYIDTNSRLLIPAPLTEKQTKKIRRLALETFRAIEGAGMARVDFLMTRNSGRIYVNEVNTIPGFTTISMYAKLWEASGVRYPILLDRLIDLALERHAEKQQLRTSLPLSY